MKNQEQVYGDENKYCERENHRVIIASGFELSSIVLRSSEKTFLTGSLNLVFKLTVSQILQPYLNSYSTPLKYVELENKRSDLLRFHISYKITQLSTSIFRKNSNFTVIQSNK